MSRTATLWTAAVLALVMALLVGAVLLRLPSTAGANVQSAASTGQPVIVVRQRPSHVLDAVRPAYDDDEHERVWRTEGHEEGEDHD